MINKSKPTTKVHIDTLECFKQKLFTLVTYRIGKPKTKKKAVKMPENRIPLYYRNQESTKLPLLPL